MNELLEKITEIRDREHKPWDMIIDDFLKSLPDYMLEYIFIMSEQYWRNKIKKVGRVIMTDNCPKCDSKEIKVKHGFTFCHDCGHIIRDYRLIGRNKLTLWGVMKGL